MFPYAPLSPSCSHYDDWLQDKTSLWLLIEQIGSLTRWARVTHVEWYVMPSHVMFGLFLLCLCLLFGPFIMYI